MSGILGTLAVRLKANTVQFSKGMFDASKKIEKVSGELRGMGAVFAATGAGLALLGAKSAKVFGRFEDSIVSVGAVSNTLGTKTFKELEARALEMGATTRFSAAQSADAMVNMAMAGMKAKDIMAGIPEVLNLAAAGSIDLASSADIVTNIMAGYGKQASELGKVNDILVETFTGANVDLIQLGESFKMVGPIAKAAGLELTETAAAIGMLGNIGIKGTMAGTALKQGIASLLKPTSRQTKLLKILNIEVKKNADGTLRLADTLKQFESYTNDAALMLEVFGDRAGPGMTGLIDQGIDKLKELTKQVDREGKSAKIAEAKNNTFNGQMDILKSTLERTAIAIGQSLAPAIKVLADALQSVLGWFNGLSETTQTVITTIGALTSAVTALGGAFLLSVSFIPNIVGGFKALSVFAPLIAPAITGIKIALAALAAKAVPIITAIAGAFPLVTIAVVAVGGALFAGKKIWEKWGDDIKEIVSSVSSTVSETASDIKETMISTFSDWTSTSETSVRKWFNKITGWISGAHDRMKSLASMMFGGGLAKLAAEKLGFGQGDKQSGGQIDVQSWYGPQQSSAQTFGEMFGGKEGPITKAPGQKPKRKPKRKPVDWQGALDKEKKVKTKPFRGLSEIDEHEKKLIDHLYKLRESKLAEISREEKTRKEKEAQAEAKAQVKSDFYAGQGSKVLGAMGGAGSAISSGMQGMASAGPMGAVAGAGLDLLMQTESMQNIMAYFQDVVGVLVEAFEPLGEGLSSLAPIVGEVAKMLGTALAPVFKILGDLISGPVFTVLKAVAWIIGQVFKGIGTVWNWIIGALQAVLGKIPKWGDDIKEGLEKYKMDVESIGKSTENLEKMTASGAKAQVKAAGELEESTKRLNEQLTNLPSGLKVALRRFESVDAVNRDSDKTSGNIIENINVQAVSPKDFWNKTKQVMNSDNFTKSGSTVMGTGQYAVVKGGA